MTLKSLFLLMLCVVFISAERRPAVFDIRDYGAIDDGKTSSTKSIQAAIDACAKSGGGTVLVPPGNFVTGTLWLKSNITFRIEAGATLLGSQDKAEFPDWVSEWEGPKVPHDFVRYAPLFAGEKLENVSLVGHGVVDARGGIWWEMQRAKKGEGEVMRPRTLRLVNSHKILIEGLTFKNSPYWTLSPLACENVTVQNVTINNPPDSPNTDGINPESCRNFHISNCHIDVGDDCITIKSGKETDGRRELWPSENITITNCTMVHGHGGVVFGSEMSGSIRNVTIDNCVFVGTDRGLRFKSRRGRGGVIEDVRASNIVMDGVLCPIAVNLFYGPGSGGDKKFTDSSPLPVDDSTPRFRRLRFSNITAKHVKYAAAYIMGLPEMPVQDVSCENITFILDADNTKAGAPDMAPNSPKLARAGFLAQRVERLSLRNIEIIDQTGPAVTVMDATNLLLADVVSRSPNHDGPAFDLRDVEGAAIRNCVVADDTAVALRIAGERTSGIRLGDNDFSRAKNSVEVDKNVKDGAVASASPQRGNSGDRAPE